MLIEGRLERQGDAVNIVAKRLIPIPVEPSVESEQTMPQQPRLAVTSHDYR